MFAQNVSIDCSRTLKVPEIEPKTDLEKYEKPPELFFSVLC